VLRLLLSNAEKNNTNVTVDESGVLCGTAKALRKSLVTN